MAYETFTRSTYAPKGAVRVIVGTTEGQSITVDFSTHDKGALIYWAGDFPGVDAVNKARAAAGLEPLAQWQIAFPDQAADHMPTIPAGFVDHSWHNDMCPRFESEALNLSLWVDHSDPQRREFPEMKRFNVYEGTSMAEHMNEEPTLSTDDWSDVVAFIAEREGRDVEAARAEYLGKLAREAADAAANAMALVIQKGIGDHSGDIAGLFFSNDALETMAAALIRFERATLKPEG